MSFTQFQRDADVARHASRKVDDVKRYSVAAGLEKFLKELKELLRQPGQRLLPAWLGLIDGASAISAQFIGKPNDQHLGQAIIRGPFDDRRGARHAVGVGDA